MPNDIDARSYTSWEVDPSTRDSLHLWNKSVPVDTTLATTNTAEDVFNVNTLAPTVNLATNPSFETGDPPTGYTATGSTLAQSATYARSGTYSLSINPDNAASGEGAYWTSPTIAGPHDVHQFRYLVVSAYARDAAGGGDGVQLIIRDSTGATTHATGTAIALTSSFARMQATFKLPASGAAYRVYAVTSAQHNTTFYVDDFQVELREDNNPTTYCDGAQGVNYEWDGTAHASISRRRIGLRAIRNFDLYVDRDTYVAFDTDASSDTGIYLPANSTWSPESAVHIRSRISFINAISGETPRIRGVVWGVHFPQS